MSRCETVVCYVAGAFLGLLTTSCERRTDAPPKRPPKTPVGVASSEVAWGEPVNGLQAGMAVTGVDVTKIAFRFTVRNVGTKPIRILKLSEQHWCPLPVAIRVVGQSPRYRGVQLVPPPLQAKYFINLPPGTGSSAEPYTLLFSDWGIRTPCEMSVTFAFSWQAKEVTTGPSPSPKVGGLWTGVACSGAVGIEITAKGGTVAPLVRDSEVLPKDAVLGAAGAIGWGEPATVTVSVFSGLPDPHWKLDAEDIETLKERMASLSVANPSQEQRARMSALGYRGFVVRSKGVAGLPETFQALDGVVRTAAMPFGLEAEARYFNDDNDVEGWLIEQAFERQLGPKVKQLLREHYERAGRAGGDVTDAAEGDRRIAWGEPVNGLRFRVWTDKQRYEEGEDIWLHAEYQNTNAEDLVIRVNHTPEQFPPQELAPLYSLGLFLNHQREEGGEFSSTIELLPIHSSMFWITPVLRKLPAGQTYEEKCRLDSRFWSGTRRTPGYVFEPGRFTLQAAYSSPAPGPLARREEERLRELGARLWEGRLVSNRVSFEVVEGELRAWGEPIEGLRAALEVRQRRVGSGEPIVVKMLVRNTSQKTLSLFDAAHRLGWRVLFRSSGAAKARPALNMLWFAPEERVPSNIKLAAGEARSAVWFRVGGRDWRFPADERALYDYDMAMASPDALPPGRYAVTASYAGPPGNLSGPYWHGKVTTGAVEIEIAPKEVENE